MWIIFVVFSTVSQHNYDYHKEKTCYYTYFCFVLRSHRNICCLGFEIKIVENKSIENTNSAKDFIKIASDIFNTYTYSQNYSSIFFRIYIFILARNLLWLFVFRSAIIIYFCFPTFSQLIKSHWLLYFARSHKNSDPQTSRMQIADMFDIFFWYFGPKPTNKKYRKKLSRM